MEGNGPRTVLDLDEMTLGDVEGVRFLGGCEAVGMTILHGHPTSSSGSAGSRIDQDR
jgi:hypothetical protein